MSLGYSWWRWRWVGQPLQGQPPGGGWGAGTDGSPTRTLSLSPMVGGGWTSTPLLGIAACPGLSGTWPLGSGGWFWLGDAFHCHPQKSTCGPWRGNPTRYVGRGGVLGNLMFSTLTPFFVFKVGVGTAAKSGAGLDPSLSPLPSRLPCSGWWVAAASQSSEPSSYGGRALGASARSAHFPLWWECSQVALTDTFNERD